MRHMSVGRGLLPETFAHLRRCGAGRSECVIYWTGPLGAPGTVDGVLHPLHYSSPAGYEIDQGWLHHAWLELDARQVEIRVQVHTHPGCAFHSALDDEFPIVQTAGLLSLVIPRLATGPVNLNGSYLTELQTDGSWLERDAGDVFDLEP